MTSTSKGKSKGHKSKQKKTSTVEKQNKNDSNPTSSNLQQESHGKEDKKSTKNKLCIISANNSNKILQIANDMLDDNFNVTHYTHSQGGISVLLGDIATKLKKFNKNDYYIIMIGETDFKETNNYYELTVTIRNMLAKTGNTNIIICLPTYRCDDFSVMYNWRVETFNNLLYRDQSLHKNAYIIDSNLNLSYDYDMFTRSHGLINNKGMRNIYSQVKDVILDIEAHKPIGTLHYAESQLQTTSKPNNCTTKNTNETVFTQNIDDQFFRG